jgi:hypothetical protein
VRIPAAFAAWASPRTVTRRSTRPAALRRSAPLLALGQPVLAGVAGAAGPLQRPPSSARRALQRRELVWRELDPGDGQVAAGGVEAAHHQGDGLVVHGAHDQEGNVQVGIGGVDPALVDDDVADRPLPLRLASVAVAGDEDALLL